LAREELEDMTDEREPDQTQGGAELHARRGDPPVAARASANRFATSRQQQRDPLNTLTGCERILILGRTGSGKTTIARELAAALGVPHVELDSLYFGPDFSTAPMSLLRERTSAAIAGDRWVTDGNKRAVRDLVWPRADTVIWLDYSVYVSLCRLAKRARTRTSALSARAAQTGRRNGLPKQMLAAARGVLTALKSHRGQRREYPRMLAHPANRHLAVARLRSPRATREWMARVTEVSRPPA
jgi:energy-coupling factor transporter ATP-binding protein EcfA2